MFETIDYEPRKCAKHDIDYTCEIVQTPVGNIATRCPRCVDEEMSTAMDMHRDYMNQSVRRQQQRMTSSGIPPRYQSRTMNNYRTTTENQAKALGDCRIFADGFEQCMKTGASIFMFGSAGTGKTHLACAIANQLMEQGYTAIFLNVSRMFRRIRETYRHDSAQTEQQAIDALVRVDLLIIDEVGVQRGTESEEQLLFEVLNDRYGSYKPTILISNLPFRDARAYVGTRILDRMREGGGKVIAFDWDSYRGNVLNDAELPVGEVVREAESASQSGLRPFPKDD